MIRALPVLAALALLGAETARAQGGLAGSDTSETTQVARGLPWIAHSSAEAFYLRAPSGEAGSRPYQLSAYQGITIQSLSFASFHAGWRFRETMAPGLSMPYREVFALKLLGTAELLRDHLFATLGGSVPLVDAALEETDTAALYRTLSGYSPLPAPNYVTPQGLQAGLFGRYRLAAWDLMAGASYYQPTRFEPVAGHPFHPASQLGGSLRAALETDLARHRWDFKASRYGEEETVAGTPAHREGRMFQLRYAWLRAWGRTAWQLGMGGAVKTHDSNRLLRLRAVLEPSEVNDNLQRGYAEAAWTWTPRPSLLWRAWLVPKALMEWSSRETGHETELGVAVGMRIWGVHRLRAAATLHAASFKGADYLGAGARLEFAFRHLGFQDLEAQPGPEEGGN